jgi:RNA polymerase sigma-70 factor (ECF subfamily)
MRVGRTAAPAALHADASSADDERARLSTVEALFRRHHPRVYRLALRYAGGDAGFAEDVTQDVFITLLERVDELQTLDALEGWLYRVTCNCCLQRLRRRRMIDRLRGLIPGLGGSAAPDPEARLSTQRELERVWSTIESLDPRERVVLCMHHLDGKQQHEIAEILGLSRGYVCKLLHRAQARVREKGWDFDVR